MRWMRMAGGAAVIAAAMLLTSDVIAGKPGGGTPTPGTIFFKDNSTSSPSGLVVMAMDGNGANRTVLTRTGTQVRPSRSLHGGRRWLLAREAVQSEPGFGGVFWRYDVFAVREDGTARVRLTSDPLTEYLGVFDWAPDENASGATIGMLARGWTSARDSVVPGSCGFYTAHLSFDAAGNVVGLDAQPTYQVSLGTVIRNGHETPDAEGWSWAPDMSRLAVHDYNVGFQRADPQLRVVDITSGAVTPLGPGRDADWSPDGSKIAYAVWTGDGSAKNPYKWAIETMNPDGSGRQTVLSVRQRLTGYTSQYVGPPRWSPDGAYLAYKYTFEQNGSSWTDYVYRVAPNGSGNTNLTPEVTTGSGGGTFGLSLVDWR